MKRYLFWKSYLTLQIIVSKHLQQSFCLLCLSSSVLKTLGLAALEQVTDNMQNKLKYIIMNQENEKSTKIYTVRNDERIN
mmetsp:Transcript_397/g.577  ORF Transcript_397/g.577 Transcript_397/m.577 type:complete len:80 (-) Transcript_397:14-253(-)